MREKRRESVCERMSRSRLRDRTIAQTVHACHTARASSLRVRAERSREAEHMAWGLFVCVMLLTVVALTRGVAGLL